MEITGKQKSFRTYMYRWAGIETSFIKLTRRSRPKNCKNYQQNKHVFYALKNYTKMLVY